MTLRPRLGRLERLARLVGRRPARCRACGEPDPGMPEMAVLVHNGFEERRPPCERCGQGSALLALDPETGEPERDPKLIMLVDPLDLRAGSKAALTAWLNRNHCTACGPDQGRLMVWLGRKMTPQQREAQD